MRFAVRLVVSLTDGLLDPQGKAGEVALPALGWSHVDPSTVGQSLALHGEADDEAAAALPLRPRSGRCEGQRRLGRPS